MLGASYSPPVQALFRKPRLIGYVLTLRHINANPQDVEKLEDQCARISGLLDSTEWDVGVYSNPMRVGLWRVLRRLVCNQCVPKRMSFSIVNFDDFLDQALAPCHCKSPVGLDGIAVNSISHLTNNQEKGSKLILKLAFAGKHVVADDGICLSCCHPATKAIVNRAAS